MSSLSHNPPASEGWGAPPFDPVPFARFRDEVLALYEPPQRAPGTFIKMRQVLGIVGDLVGPDGTTSALAPALVARLIAARPAGQSPHTTDGLLRNLRCACNYAVSQGYLRSSPFTFRRKWVRTPAPRGKQHHGLDEIARVLELARADVARKVPGSWSQWRSRRLYVMAATVAYTGLRRNEALHLRVEDVDLAGRMLLIRPRRGNALKTDASAQPVPIPDALAQILAEWLPYLALPEGPVADVNAPMPRNNPEGRRDPGWLIPNAYRTGPWTGGSPGQKPLDRLKRLGERAGVEGFTFMSLRHSYATHAESAWGFSEAMIQRVLRHTNRRTQQHYRHADLPNLKAGVKGLGFGSEPAPLPDAVWDAALPPAASAPAGGHTGAETPRAPRPSGPKLSPEDVAEMKELRDRGWTYAALMARYKVAKSTLHYALYGVTHRGADRPGDGPGAVVPS